MGDDCATEFIERVKVWQRINSIAGHLGWDQETLMPPKGAKSRGETLAWLASESHRHITDPALERCLSELESRLDSISKKNPDLACNVRRMRRSVDQASKLPADLVTELTRTQSEAMQIWQQARAESDFSLFAPVLGKIIGLTKQKMKYLGGENATYDILLDEYEIGMTMADYDPLFAGLRQRLVPLLEKIVNASKDNPSPSLPEGMKFAISAQESFCTNVSKLTGFDFEAGRMDPSTHPFSAGLWAGDTRFTTRYDLHDPFSCLYAVLHETGHALYEQGLPEIHTLTPRANAISLGVHESQSRLWENQIGRTASFWSVVLDDFRNHFPDLPLELTPADMNRIANHVEPSFIRVEADEVTYNLHVMLRYEVEKQIFDNDLPVEEIPRVWNELFAQWFGLEVPDDAHGCLQDVHWSMAAFGYFPTYTLGNLYAAQLLNKMSDDLGSIDTLVSSGDWSAILDWLRNEIHQHGMMYDPSELIERATGKLPSPEAFLNYIETKYSQIYDL
ncbi:MAG: carboxypeptidase M32 [Euryarchaeota archaeon]|nr:carboxypeptidase M32 [Euryarchaeota archaeon]